MAAPQPLPIEDIDPPPVDVAREVEFMIGRSLAEDYQHLTPAAGLAELGEEVALIAAGVGARERWRIGGDDDAEWAMAKLITALAAVARVEAQRAAYVAKVDRWHLREIAEPRRTVSYFTAQLELWALRRRQTAEDLNPKRFAKTFRVPSGHVSTRGGGAPHPVITDEATLLAWCMEHLPGVVKETTTRKVLLGDLKDHIDIIDPDPDGEARPLIVVTREVTGDGEVVRGTEPIPGVDYDIPNVTPTVHPNDPEE